MKGSDRISRSSTLLTTEVDGELLAMSVEQGACYGLDPVATVIWNLLDRPRTVDGLCTELVERFDVTDAQCRADVIAFLTQMTTEAMIEIAPGGDGAGSSERSG